MATSIHGSASSSPAATSAASRPGGTGLVSRLRRHPPALIGAVWLIAISLLALFGPILHAVSYETIDPAARLAPPSAAHLLGTDENGRDVLARLLYGGRISLSVGLLAAAVAITLGTGLGAVAGQVGGRTDAVLMRLTDTFMSVPSFFVLLMLLALFGGATHVLILGIGLTSWEGVARVVRSEILRSKSLDFVVAARAVGLRERRLLWKHLLPQAVPSIIVACMLSVAFAILTETALSYLGLGIRAPTPSWGNMLSGAQGYLWIAPGLAVYPGLLITSTILAINIFGDGLRDALDPQLIGAR